MNDLPQPEPKRLALSIIIVSWNTRRLLCECLESLEKELNMLGESVETIVVDNASGDGSAEAVSSLYPWVYLIRNPENRGFSGANNDGLQQARGELVLLLNPDTQVVPGAISQLVNFMREHPEAGACGSMLLESDGSLQVSCYPEPTLFREFWRLFHLDHVSRRAAYSMDTWSPAQARKVEVLQGACLMVRRSAIPEEFDAQAILDEDYLIYSEDVDLCHRIRRNGWQLYWVPQSIVVHHGGQSTKQRQATMFLRLYQSKLLYFRKHRGNTRARAYKLILFLAAVTRIAAGPFASVRSPEARRELAALSKRYRQLIKVLPNL